MAAVMMAILSTAAFAVDLLPLSARYAEIPANKNATVKKEAISIWVKRYGIEGLKITSSQLLMWALPSIILKPCGVCIHEFKTMIQKAERVVPKATRNVARVCTPCDTRLAPNNMMPKKVASKKKAVKTS